MNSLSIQELLFYSTVRIRTGPQVDNWIGCGTAFGMALDCGGGQQLPCLVTNKHVVSGAEIGEFFFFRERKTENGLRADHTQRVRVLLDRFEHRWIGHPDPSIDVAVLPIGGILNSQQTKGESVFFPAFPSGIALNDSHYRQLNVIEEVTFVGYPSGIWDEVNGLPVARRGVIASPLQYDHSGQPVFLMDASVFPGSSGSPVLICNTGSYSVPNGSVVGNRLILLGIVARVFHRTETNLVQAIPAPTNLVPAVENRQMIDLGIVFKARTILETLEHCRALLPAPQPPVTETHTAPPG